MLYQLSIYALSNEAGGQATILYPTLNAAAVEACTEIRDPLGGARRGEVWVRPVDMLRLERFITGPRSPQRERAWAAFACWLAFGNEEENV